MGRGGGRSIYARALYRIIYKRARVAYIRAHARERGRREKRGGLICFVFRSFVRPCAASARGTALLGASGAPGGCSVTVAVTRSPCIKKRRGNNPGVTRPAAQSQPIKIFIKIPKNTKIVVDN